MTAATVLPAVSGRLISYTEIVSVCELPVPELRYGIEATVFSPSAAVPAQSLNDRVPVLVDPSV